MTNILVLFGLIITWLLILTCIFVKLWHDLDYLYKTFSKYLEKQK